jgi:hypothetical protein
MHTRFKALIVCLIAAVWFSSIPVYAADEGTGDSGGGGAVQAVSVDYPVLADAFVRKSKGINNFSSELITKAHGAQYEGQGINVINSKFFNSDEIIAAMKFALPTKEAMEEQGLSQFDFVFNIFKNANPDKGNQSYIFHYSTETDWNEGTLTWDNKPAFLDRTDTNELFRFNIAQNDAYEFKSDAEKRITTDITNTVIDLVDEGVREITVFVTALNSLDSSILIHSKETSDVTKRPKIVASSGQTNEPEPGEPIDPNDPLNIAYQKPARSNLSKDMAANATDGNVATTWSGIFYPSYVDIDLMDQYDLSEVQLFVPTGKVVSYTLYGSNDGATYDKLYQKRDKTAATASGDRIVLEAGTSYRIIRVYMEYTQGENTAYLSEVRVHGTKTNTNTEPLRDGDLEEILGLQDFRNTEYASVITANETYENIYGIVERTVGPQYRDWFSFEVAPNAANDNDYFELSDRGGKVHIAGNKGISITTGLNYYYKNYLNVHVSEQTMQVNMPSQIVSIGETVRKETEYKIRYAFNYCTLSYSFAFFGMDDWQRENDWLALNGVNVVLDLAGQEATWVKFLMNFGYSFDDAKDWLTGPGYNAWQFMSNMEAFGGPVPDGYIVDRAELARSTQRWKNSLGMQTVLQGYAGMVPTNFKEFQPDVEVIKQGTWSRFSRPDMIATDSALYDEYAELFYEAQEFVYGQTSDYYAADPFHEGGNRPTGLSDATIATEVLNSMLEYDEDAVWIVQGWQSNPTNDLLKGMGDRREDHVLIVDLIKYPIASWTKYNRTSYGSTRLDSTEFNNTKWVWGLLGNFGGNPSMHGQMEVMVNDIQNAKRTSNHMAGLGIISEAQYENPILYDLIFDLAWAGDFFNLDQWISKYLERRYGGTSENAKLAWDIMKKANYNYGVRYTTQIYGMKNTTPQNFGKQNIAYGADKLEVAFRLLASDFDKFKTSEAYLYDLTEIMRQLVSNYSVHVYNELLTAKEENDIEAFQEAKLKFLNSFDLLNAVQATQRDQLAGEWIGKAQDLAAAYDDFSKDAFELNAKTLITTWGSRASYGSLKEYGWRNYEGMFIDMYKHIWEEYLDKVEANLLTGSPINTISTTGYFEFYWDWVLNAQNYTRDAKDSPEELLEVVELVIENAMLSGELDPNLGNRALGRLTSTDTKSVLGKLSSATDGKADSKVTLRANSTVKEPELIVDLVGSFQLSKIEVLIDSFSFDRYELYTSSDMISWDKVGEMAASDISDTADEFLIADAYGRYVKIKAISMDTDNGLNKGLAINEIRVFGEPILPTLEDLSSLVGYAKTINLDASEPTAANNFTAALQSAETAIANNAAVDEVNSVYWNLYESVIKLYLVDWKNLSLNKPVSAHNDPSGFSGRLVDNNESTAWNSGRLSTTGQPYEQTITPGWAIVNLEDDYKVEAIQLMFGNQNLWYNYELHSSLDGITWTKLAEKTSKTTPNKEEDYHSVDNVIARYIKIVTTNIQVEGSGQRASYGVAELRVLGSELDAVTAVADAADLYVPQGTSAEDLLAELPAAVEATLASGATETAAVTWDVAGSEYDGATVGEYTVTGTLSSGVYNPDELTASVKVVVVEPGELEPPAWPEGSALTATNIGRTGLTLTWTSAEDQDAVTGYNIYRGAQLVVTTEGDATTYAITGLSPGTTYTFKVEAGNELGQWTTDGPSITITTERDSTPGNPDTPIVTPEPEPTDEPNVINVTKPQVGADGIAKASIDSEAYNKAAAGGAQVEIKVEATSEATGYEVVLPPNALASGDKQKSVVIRTALGTIAATSDLLTAAAVSGAKEVSLSIAKAGQGAAVDIVLKVDGKEQAWRSEESKLDVFLPYTPTAAELADAAFIIVWHIDEEGNTTAVASGKYDAELEGLTFQAGQTGRYSIQYVHKTFDDLEGYGWAKQAIEAMASRGIINGTTSVTYNPGAAIKRADFIALLVRTLGLKSTFDVNFDDVAADAYYAEEVAIAKALGIAQGKGDNQFKPEQSISRQEMMMLIDRALEQLGKPLAKGSASDLEGFDDHEAIAGYAQQSVANLVKSDLVKGKGDGIDPVGQATRAEIAVLIERLYHYVS